MKKLILLFVVVLSVGFTSCSKDDDNAQGSLSGKWEFLKDGTIINGTETLQNYDHSPNCEKDHFMITENDFVEHRFERQECTEFITPYTYTRNGNIVTASDQQGASANFEIVQLDNTTLKIKTIPTEGTAVSYVTVFVRR